MHTYMKITLFAGMLIGFLLFFTSCDDNDPSFLNQDRIYTSYELYYNGNADKTYARATFKLENKYGTLLKLGDISSIIFKINDSIPLMHLDYLNEYGYYEKERSEFWYNSGMFYFTNEEETQYVNNIHVNVATFPETIDTIVQGKSWELSWDAQQSIALEENESISLTFTGIEHGDVHTFHQFEEGSESIIISRDETSELEPGTYTLFLDRRYQPELTQKASAGGTITGRYRPANRTVVVVEE
ncbi:MAG: hypothetical protein PF590_06565 [Candidatus Delongbacteria bacterium]|jgi:hypothetical protein|nr:hypothetical protein [Candidatus Delongbacteria bacterium]